MEVPDNILYLTDLLSPGALDGEATGEYAAKIYTPGAVISGCNMWQTYIYIYISVRNEIHLSNTCIPGKTVIDGQPLKFRQKLNLAHEKRRKQI